MQSNWWKWVAATKATVSVPVIKTVHSLVSEVTPPEIWTSSGTPVWSFGRAIGCLNVFRTDGRLCSSRGWPPHREASPESKPGRPSGDIWLNSKKWWGGGSTLSPAVSCCVKASEQNPHSKPINFPASVGTRLVGSRVGGGRVTIFNSLRR